MAEDNKTEKATEHRRHKAHEEGQVARSRELSATAAMLAAILVLVAQGPPASCSGASSSVPCSTTPCAMNSPSPLRCFPGPRNCSSPGPWKPLAAAWGVAVLVSLAQGGVVFAPKLLAPDIAKLNPAKKLGQIFSITTLVQVLKALVPGSAIVFIAIDIFRREWPTLGLGLWASPRQISAHLFNLVFEVFWKSSLVLLAWAVVDYIAMRQKFESGLRMSKQEIRDEMKQTDGNPATKGRIRRLQRQARRQRMLQATRSATVVVTNPTHFAVALEYSRPDGRAHRGRQGPEPARPADQGNRALGWHSHHRKSAARPEPLSHRRGRPGDPGKALRRRRRNPRLRLPHERHEPSNRPGGTS